jgi:hypothetical protein
MNSIHLRDVLISTDKMPPIRSARQHTSTVYYPRLRRVIGLSLMGVAGLSVVALVLVRVIHV